MSEPPAKKGNGNLEEVLAVVATHIGNLYALNIMQASAVTKLASAIKSEPSVSVETQEKAVAALEQVDRMIEILKKASVITEDDLSSGLDKTDE